MDSQPLDEPLDLALLQADLALRQKQLSWETPKTRHTLCGLATIMAALVALATYVGSRQPQPQHINATISGSLQLLPPK
jgi:hypothetical protein